MITNTPCCASLSKYLQRDCHMSSYLPFYYTFNIYCCKNFETSLLSDCKFVKFKTVHISFFKSVFRLSCLTCCLTSIGPTSSFLSLIKPGPTVAEIPCDAPDFSKVFFSGTKQYWLLKSPYELSSVNDECDND